VRVRYLLPNSGRCLQSHYLATGLHAKIHRVIHLRCHKKNRKCCRNECTLLPVSGTYTCRKDTIFVSQHTDILTLNMTTAAEAALYIPREKLRHVARSISGVIWANAAVIFCRRSASLCGLCPYTSDLTYRHTKKSGGVKSGEFMGPSRPHQWLFHVPSKNSRDFVGLWIMAYRMSSSPFLPRTPPAVWGIVRQFCRNMLYHFTLSQCEGTWWLLHWRRKARLVLVTLENFAVAVWPPCLSLMR
jgi:hypothetical protein